MEFELNKSNMQDPRFHEFMEFFRYSKNGGLSLHQKLFAILFTLVENSAKDFRIRLKIENDVFTIRPETTNCISLEDIKMIFEMLESHSHSTIKNMYINQLKGSQVSYKGKILTTNQLDLLNKFRRNHWDLVSSEEDYELKLAFTLGVRKSN